VIGSIKETQDVINLCDKHKIYPEIKLVSVTELNKVYTDLDSGNPTALRYVLDIENTLNESTVCNEPAPTLSPNKTNFNIGSVLSEFTYMFFTFKWM